MGALASRAASREATTVEEEVTFCNRSATAHRTALGRAATHDGGNREIVLLAFLKELQNIFTCNDTALPAENFGNTHCCSWLCYVGEVRGRGRGRVRSDVERERVSR